jgi:hypothetical protein
LERKIGQIQKCPNSFYCPGKHCLLLGMKEGCCEEGVTGGKIKRSGRKLNVVAMPVIPAAWKVEEGGS